MMNIMIFKGGQVQEKLKKFNFSNNKIQFDAGMGVDLYAINSRPTLIRMIIDI